MESSMKSVIESVKRKLDVLEKEHESISEKVTIKEDEIKSLNDMISTLQNLQSGIDK